jgi:lysozyme
LKKNIFLKSKKVKKLKYSLLWWFLIVTSPVVIYAGKYLYTEIKAGYIRYKSLGILVPPNYKIYGIDISKYQGIINWESVKKMEGVKIDFAYIKATEGTNFLDSHYFQNWWRVKDANIPRGAYHFFIPSKSAVAQAQHFCRVVKLKKGDLPPVLDVEIESNKSAEEIRKGVRAWLIKVENKYGMKPIIYTNADFYKRILSGHFDEYPLWVAHYGFLDKPKVDKKWLFWQISEEANINGIAHKVDFNVFNGTLEDLNKLRKK